MKPVILVGAPGSGKTTVGRAVATEWNMDFVDVDERIEQLAEKPIREIFVDEGEPYFRQVETDLTLKALTENAVISLGGGAVATEEIREALMPHRVVWLQVSAQQAARRVGINASRPLLWGDVRDRLSTLLAERTPWYEQVASIRIDTDHKFPGDVAQAVLDAVKETQWFVDP